MDTALAVVKPKNLSIDNWAKHANEIEQYKCEQKKLHDLFEKINYYDEQATAGLSSFLHNAHLAGIKLNKAKELLAHGEWIDYVKKYFKGKSYQTAIVYMRIADNWDEPCLVKAREQKTIMSLNKAQEILRENKLNDAEKTTKKTKEKRAAIAAKKDLIDEFKHNLRMLKPHEAAVLGNIMKNLWNDVILVEIRKNVIEELGFSPYNEDGEWVHENVNA